MGNLVLGQNGTGTYNLSGGTLATAAITGQTNPATGYAGSAQLNLSGGTLKSTGFTTTVPIAAAGGASTINTTGGDIHIMSAINGAGGLVKTGTNSLYLIGNNNYSGGTTINGGTMAANGFGNGTVTINGGTLAAQGLMPGLLAQYYSGLSTFQHHPVALDKRGHAEQLLQFAAGGAHPDDHRESGQPQHSQHVHQRLRSRRLEHGQHSGPLLRRVRGECVGTVQLQRGGRQWRGRMGRWEPGH